MTKKSFISLFIFTLLFATCLFSQVQVGEEIPERFESNHPYKGIGIVDEQEFMWPDASYISIHFSKFDLAPGDHVEVCSPDGNYVYIYKEKGKTVRGGQEQISEFWATHIPGDTAIVRLISHSNKEGYGFVIDKWARGYEANYLNQVFVNLEKELIMDADIQTIYESNDKKQAKSYEGTKSKAVCRLLIDGVTACTGRLLGSEENIITTQKCIDSQYLTDRTDYGFMAKSSNLGGNRSILGTVKVTSGTLEKDNSTHDYSLIRFPIDTTRGTTEMYVYDITQLIWEIGDRYRSEATITIWDDNSNVVPYATVYYTWSGVTSGSGSAVTDAEGKIYPISNKEYSTGPFILTVDNVTHPNLTYNSSLNNETYSIENYPLPPTANFSANTTSIGTGESVQFTDTSHYGIFSWSWTFYGGTPSTSSQENPNVTYNTAGTYTVALTVTNTAGNDTETKVGYITVTAPPSPPVAPSNVIAEGPYNGVIVTWYDNSDNETGFKIYRNGLLVATVGANAMFYKDVIYPPSGSHSYKVCAYNSYGESCSPWVDALIWQF